MSDAFISYSHLDRDFAIHLQTALKNSGKAIWVDEADIPSGSRWAEDLKEAIEDADTFVFVISPDSAGSEECKKELDYAVQLHKRIIPVNLRHTPIEALPESIRVVQFVPPRGLFEGDLGPDSESPFEYSLQLLITTIDTDLDANREHTEWGKKALEWDKHTQDPSFLLSGSELESAEHWLVRGSQKGPEPTELQKAYILASRLRANRRQRRLLVGVSIALVVALVLGGLAVVQRNDAISQSHLSQSEDMAAEATNLFSTDVPLAMLVSLQAYERSPALQARDALDQAAEQRLAPTLYEGNVVYSVAFSPNGRTLAVGDESGDVGLWDTATGKRTATLSEGKGTVVYSVAFSPNGQTLAVGDSGGYIGLWHAAGERRTATLSEGSAVLGVAFSPNGKSIAVGDVGGDVGLWDTASRRRTATLSEGSTVGSVAFSPNGRTLAAGDNAGDVGLWDPARRQRTGTLSEGSAVLGIAFSPSGQTVAAGADGGDVGLWDTASGQRTAALPEGSAVLSVAFSPNGHTLAVGDNYGEVGLWDTANEERTAALFADSGFDTVAFSPNGQTLAVGDYDGDLGLWKTTGGRRPAAFALGSTVVSVAFSPNGQTLALGEKGGDVGLWNTASGKRIATLSEGSTVNSVAFSPNGQTLALGENSGTIVLVDEIVWNWNFTSLKLLLCGEVGTNMTKAQWLANVPDQPYQKTCPTSQ